MKKIFLRAFALLLWSVVFLGCNNEDNPIPDFGSILSQADFDQYVAGYGWRPLETHQMKADGNYAEEDYYKDLYGASPTTFYFGKDGTITSFYYDDATPADVYSTQKFTYDEVEGDIYVNGNLRFKVISKKDDKLTVIEKAGVNSYGDVYLYIVFQRLSEEELQKVRDTYWMNAADQWRTMTREDLLHKWVFTYYTDVNGQKKIVNRDRKNDETYIRFLADGTYEGKDGNISIQGTYEGGDFSGYTYETDEADITLTPADGSTKSGSYFLQHLCEAKTVVLTSVTYLTLKGNGKQSFHFILGVED